MKEMFNTPGYRDNLAKDLKEIRKEDPGLAKEALDEEKRTTRYKYAEHKHEEKRDQIQEDSPVLREAELKKNIAEGEKGKEKMVKFLENINIAFSELERDMLAKLDPELQNESQRMVYELNSRFKSIEAFIDNAGVAMWKTENFSTRQPVSAWSADQSEYEFKSMIDSKMLGEFNKIQNNVFGSISVPRGRQNIEERSEKINQAFKAFYLPEFQEEIEGESTGIIKAGNLYFNTEYSMTANGLNFSRSKEELLKWIAAAVKENNEDEDEDEE